VIRIRGPTTATAPSWVPAAREERGAAFRRRMQAADLLVALAWTSVALAVGLFLASGVAATTPLRTAAGLVTGAGIVAGLAATDLLLVMLVLAARVPLIDRTFGHDKALAAHRRIGKPALSLLHAHAVLLTVGYGMSDRSGPVRETVALLTSGRDMLLAYLALAVLIGVVITSLAAVRRRFAYEAWHVLHLASYVGILIALPHELGQGQVLAHGSVERIYWLALYVVAFGAMAVFRFARPVWISLRHGFRVLAVERVADDVVSIHLGGRDIDRLGAEGGQFAIWRFWSARTWFHAHPVSFSTAPTGSSLRLTVRALGAGTARLAALRPGTFVSVQGPYGLFTDRARTAPYLSVVTAGIGITPVRSLLEDADLRPGEATVLLRASDARQQYLWEEVVRTVQAAGGVAYTDTGHRPKGRATWMSATAFARGVRITTVFPHLLESDLYVCGPQGWADLVVRDARRAGLPRHRIHLERFDA
jgi:predicted ferric reductase